MRDKYFYEVMFDDTSIDVSKEVGLVWSIANSLRGAYTSDKYKDVIIPMVIMLMCFLLTYLTIICYVAIENLGGMF